MMKTELRSKLDQIKDKVGKPYFSSGNVLLYKMDCTEFMESLNSNIIDLTITSPPYNIGKEYEKTVKNEDYLEWCEKWLNQIYQSTSQFGSFWLNLGYFEFLKKENAFQYHIYFGINLLFIFCRKSSGVMVQALRQKNIIRLEMRNTCGT